MFLFDISFLQPSLTYFVLQMAAKPKMTYTLAKSLIGAIRLSLARRMMTSSDIAVTRNLHHRHRDLDYIITSRLHDLLGPKLGTVQLICLLGKASPPGFWLNAT